MNTAETIIELYKNKLQKENLLVKVKNFCDERLKELMLSRGAPLNIWNCPEISDDRDFWEAICYNNIPEYKNLRTIYNMINEELNERG